MSSVNNNQGGQKRVHSSTEDSDTSVFEESSIKPEKKRINLNSAEITEMDFPAALNKIHEQLDAMSQAMATKEDVSNIRTEIKNMSVSFQQKVEEMEGRVFEVEAKLAKIQSQGAAQKKKTEELQNVIRHQDRLIKDNERAVNDLQQYSRRWNLRVYRLPEAVGETAEDCARKVCQVFSDGVGVKTSPEDIEVAHRTGKRSTEKPRPILVRFFDRKKRDTILANRRKLKNKGTVIDEDLTYANYQLSTKAYKHSATMAVWSHNGKILAKLKNSLVIKLNIHMDLDEAFRRGMKSNTMSGFEEEMS